MSIVTDYNEGKDLHNSKKDLDLTDEDLRLYMYQAFKALDYANSKGVMHRDLHSGQITIDHPNRKLTILDWGLGDFYRQDYRYM